MGRAGGARQGPPGKETFSGGQVDQRPLRRRLREEADPVVFPVKDSGQFRQQGRLRGGCPGRWLTSVPGLVDPPHHGIRTVVYPCPAASSPHRRPVGDEETDDGRPALGSIRGPRRGRGKRTLSPSAQLFGYGQR